MDNREAVNWLINISADIGKAEHSDLWRYEQALTEIKDMLEYAQLSQKGTTKDATSDTISRQAAIDALAKQMPTPYTPDGSHPADEGIFQVQEVYADCIETLELLPSAQPERKVGKWTEDNACEFCGFKPWYERDIHTLSYCPNCGADMRGKK